MQLGSCYFAGASAARLKSYVALGTAIAVVIPTSRRRSRSHEISNYSQTLLYRTPKIKQIQTGIARFRCRMV